MIGWFRRRWISREKYDALKASYETRVLLLEAALSRHEQNELSHDLPDNLSLELLRRLKARTRTS